MSKAVKLSFMILGVLAVVALLFAGATLSQKAQLEKNQKSLEEEIEDYKGRELKLIKENKEMTEKMEEVSEEKEALSEELRTLREVNLADLQEEIENLKEEKKSWSRRLEKTQQERDELVQQLKEKPEKEIVYVEREPEPSGVAEAPPGAGAPAVPPSTPEAEEESYWAGVLREKANLQLEVEKLHGDLAAAQVELVEIKKRNSDMQLELSEVKNQKEAIEHEIKRGKDLADTLSLEVARIQNEKKFLDNRLQKTTSENEDLREKIKQLTSTKIALEKSIVRMQDEKKQLEDKLIETENVIQSRIDEIWEIKKDIDETFRPTKARQKGEVELTPIVVSASTREAEKYPYPYEGKLPGFEGNIVSVNDENNFVIVDVGKSDGLRLGDSLGVYRGAEYIAGLEVIQIRDDIAAADIKNKVSSIQIGDIVR